MPRRVPSFRLLSVDGEDLGLVRVSLPAWSPGDRIQRGQGEDLVVVRLVPAESGDEVDGYLVVDAAALPG